MGRVRPMIGMRKILRALAWSVPSLIPGSALAQCAMCNTAATGNDVGRGLSISVLFLLVTLLLMVLGFVVLVVLRASARDQSRPLREEAVDRPA